MTREELTSSREYQLTQTSLDYWRNHGEKDGLDEAFEAGAEWADEHPSTEGAIEKQPLTAKEMIEMLSKYPEDATVVIEYCHPRLMKYDKERNLIKID